MTETTIDGPGVTLADMLAARDNRADRQRQALERFGTPVVSLTVVMPGPVKDSPLTRDLFAAALAGLDALFADRGLVVADRQILLATTGPEALYAVSADPLLLKHALVALEDGHPLGRLWDIDVLVPDRAGSIGRHDIGLAARRCLVCGGDAHACARSQSHSLEHLIATIRNIHDAYRHHP
jgi:holo-ACP synthase